MADLNLGRTMQSNNGSQDSLLRSVKQQIDQTKFKGKVNDDAINAILQAIATQQENQGKYQLELASKNNDAIVDKIKDALEKLYEAQQNTDSNSSDDNVQQDTASKDDSKLLKKIQELKDEFGQCEDDLVTTEEKSTSKDYSNLTIADSFQHCQDYISSQLATVEKNILDNVGKFSLKLPTFKLPKLKLPKLKLPGANLFKGISEKISGLKDKFSGLGDSIKKKFSSFGKGLKTIGSGIKNVALAPFKAIGKAFSFLNPFKKKNDKFSFDKLTKFLKKFFDVKNINKWLDKFLKKHIKTLQKHVSIVIKPIKKLIVFAIEKIASVISSLFIKLFITFFPIIAVIWGIFALIVLAGYLLYKAYKWVKDVAIPWISDFIVKLWNSIQEVGAAIWKAIKYIFWDMWIDLGKWIWEKLVEFGAWLKEKAIDPIVGFIKTYIIQPAKNIYDKWIQPLIDSFNNLVGRLKSIWNAFKLDDSKTFLENLQEFWKNIKTSIKEWWNQSNLKKTLDSIVEWIKNLPLKIWEKIKSFFGGVGKAISWAGDKLAGGVNAVKNLFSSKDKVKDPMQTAIDELNKERERTIEIDVGAVKDILDIVTEISKLLATTITTELHAVYKSLVPQNNTLVNDKPTIESSYQTIKIIHDSTNQTESIEDIVNEANIQENDKEAKTNIKFSNIENFLKTMSLSMNQNFQKIIDKLDDKPNLIPIPMMNPMEGNMAIMENR